jgi:predicted RNA binding protein YcfA (HicA-like mRNA interferase family)
VARKELRAILVELERQGWRVERGRGGHYKAFAPTGEVMVTLPSTPGRDLRPYIARLRRAGFAWKGRQVDYLMTVTMKRLELEDEAEALLDRFLATHAEGGPVVGEDLRAGTIDVTFVVSGGSLDDALDRGRDVCASALAGEATAHETIGVHLEDAKRTEKLSA